jgi:hypothetical protein
MYKDCIMSEMEGKSIPYSKQIQPTPASNEERSKTIDCLVWKWIEKVFFIEKFCVFQAKLKEEEKKDKKRSPLLPWTKGTQK